jgi:hypothetical protein
MLPRKTVWLSQIVVMYGTIATISTDDSAMWLKIHLNVGNLLVTIEGQNSCAWLLAEERF